MVVKNKPAYTYARFYNHALWLFLFLMLQSTLPAQNIISNGEPAELNIRKAGENSIRITLKPVSYKGDFPFSPALSSMQYSKPVISLRNVDQTVKKQVGNLKVEIASNPLKIIVRNLKNQLIQELVLLPGGNLSFKTGDQPILGMGEGGPKPTRGLDWRQQPIQFDRRGSYDSMQPRWQSDAYGSRNPVAMLTGTEGWGLFVVTPWVHVDLTAKDNGVFVPWKPPTQTEVQNQKNQHLNQGKGLPPIDKIIPGLYDVFVFDAHQPKDLMKDFSVVTGKAALPPKWALGYMQSFRTWDSDTQMIGIVDTFRNKKIPVDAVIYLGTGFCPKGWNQPQPSFEFNKEIFSGNEKEFVSKLHERDVKVIVHMVPWDRDKLPTLQGTIPAKPGEIQDASHILNYWKQHVGLVNTGINAFWPDEGDWFNLFERIKRHQMYYQGSLYTTPNVRPWSLQRNGYPGIAQWGGWVWSGDTESSWKTLEGQIAVGINYSLSIGPYWGSDIGGFYSNHELTGELYARWFQFAAFCGSFRSHGRTWHTRLPWGWGLNYLGYVEDRVPPLESELNNPAIEPITRKYDELRYQLLPYTYTLAWEARNSGMPLQRAMWLQYPDDKEVRGMGTQFMWGPNLLIAPVFEKGAADWKVYLPKGDWYDWWTSDKQGGGKYISRKVDLATMPMYAPAGAIIPVDPIRQYVNEKVEEPTTIKIFTGKDGRYVLYNDDGISQEYMEGKGSWIQFTWNDKTKQLSVEPGAAAGFTNTVISRNFKVELVPQGTIKNINYTGKNIELDWYFR